MLVNRGLVVHGKEWIMANPMLFGELLGENEDYGNQLHTMKSHALWVTY